MPFSRTLEHMDRGTKSRDKTNDPVYGGLLLVIVLFIAVKCVNMGTHYLVAVDQFTRNLGPVFLTQVFSHILRLSAVNSLDIMPQRLFLVLRSEWATPKRRFSFK